MPTSIDLIIDRQLRRWEMERRARTQTRPESETGPTLKPVITLSRQHGSNGTTIAAKLAERFQYTLLHRDTINRMCQSTGYARRLLESLDERAQSQVTNWIDAMLAGKHVDSGDYVRALFKTIYSIAELGGVVVVGRGANFIVGPERGFHARVVAPRDMRIRNLMTRTGMSERQAAHDADARDHERAAFIHRMFGRQVDDPLAYDVIVNEAETTPERIVHWLDLAARAKFERLRPLAVHST